MSAMWIGGRNNVESKFEVIIAFANKMTNNLVNYFAAHRT